MGSITTRAGLCCSISLIRRAIPASSRVKASSMQKTRLQSAPAAIIRGLMVTLRLSSAVNHMTVSGPLKFMSGSPWPRVTEPASEHRRVDFTRPSIPSRMTREPREILFSHSQSGRSILTPARQTDLIERAASAALWFPLLRVGVWRSQSDGGPSHSPSELTRDLFQSSILSSGVIAQPPQLPLSVNKGQMILLGVGIDFP